MLTAEEQRPGEIRVVITSQAGDVIAGASAHEHLGCATNGKQIRLGPRDAVGTRSAEFCRTASLMVDVSDRLLSARGNSAIDGCRAIIR